MKVEGFRARSWLRAWFCCALIASGVDGALAAPATPSPPARLSDVAKPLAYDLQLSLVPNTDKFSGRVAVEVDIVQPTTLIWLNELHLDIHRATITVAGKTLPARLIPSAEAVGLKFAQTIPAGHAQVVVEYDGSFERQSQLGLMKIKEQDDWYLATNFEPHYARRVVPSFDELRAKAPWKLTLEVPIGLAAFANSPEVSEEAISASMKRVHFAATPPIASYAMAFSVGPYDVVDGGRAGKKSTPIRILVPHGMSAMAHYAAESTGRILDLSEDAVGQPYPYDKLDIVALPGVDNFGAMENVGLVTVEAALVLASAGHEDAAFEQNYAATASHEIAHMWFGNSVTPAGWNDLWLNEGFADWLMPKTEQRLNPSWQMDLQIDDARANALMTDRLLSAHPVRLRDDSPEAAEGAFDPIVYAKGASVLRMLEHFMGEDRFREAVRRYLQAHQGGSASAEDFYATLSAAADPHVAADVVPMLQSFLNQPGAPGLEVGLQCGDASKSNVRLDLNQFRFAPRGRVGPALPAALVPAQEHWLMPVCFQYGEGGDYGETCTLMRDSHMSLALPDGEACPDWVIANTDGFGYLLPLLRDPLTARLDHAPLLPNEAVPVLDDARVLLASDALGADSALKLAARFANHRQPLVSLASVRLAGALPQGLIDAADARDSYARFIHKVYGPRAEALGWQAKPGERDTDGFLRVELVPMAAAAGADSVLRADADKLARDALAGHADLGPMLGRVLDVAAMNGNQELFDSLSTAAQKSFSPVRQMELHALGQFHDPHLLDEAFDLALTDKLDVRDAEVIFRSAAADQQQPGYVLDYVKTHFDAIDKRFASAGEFLAAAASKLCDHAQRQELEQFITEHASHGQQLRASFNDAFEKEDLCEAGRDLQVPRIKSFLAQQGS
jgi:alanyl aminopeptidase